MLLKVQEIVSPNSTAKKNTAVQAGEEMPVTRVLSFNCLVSARNADLVLPGLNFCKRSWKSSFLRELIFKY